METTTNLKERGFATISTPDGRHRIWLHRPTPEGSIHASCNFALAGHYDFVDAVDTLGYVSVYSALTYDNDYSSMNISCLMNPAECMERLMEDLPKVMEEWL